LRDVGQPFRLRTRFLAGGMYALLSRDRRGRCSGIRGRIPERMYL